MTDVEFEVPGAPVRVAKAVQNSVTVVRVEIVVVEVVTVEVFPVNRASGEFYSLGDVAGFRQPDSDWLNPVRTEGGPFLTEVVTWYLEYAGRSAGYAAVHLNLRSRRHGLHLYLLLTGKGWGDSVKAE